MGLAFYMFAFLLKVRGCSLLAQLVEHYLDKVGVSSSSLLETTIFVLVNSEQ